MVKIKETIKLAGYLAILTGTAVLALYIIGAMAAVMSFASAWVLAVFTGKP